jgi:hypothetical protein
MEQKGTWRAILADDEARLARLIAEHIADEVASAEEHSRQDSFRPLLDAHLATALDSDRHADRALNAVTELCAGISATHRPALYSGGVAGVGWTVAHVTRLLTDWLEPEDADACDDFDAFVERVVNGSRRGDYDLISGLVGFAVYALERAPHGRWRQILEQVVCRLENEVVATPDGVTWHTPSDLLPSHQREIAPDGYYNLGVAHGSPGIAVILARAVAAGVRKDAARRLLDGLTSWILAQQSATGHGARFTAWVVGTRPEASVTREAWCYGGLGLSVALLKAAQLVGDEKAKARGVELALLEAMRAPDVSGVQDMCICHGGAGNGHLYNRLYQATGDEAFLNAARKWFRVTLESYRPGCGGPGGYLFYGPKDMSNPAGELGMRPDATFLSGSIGVGLALLAAATDRPPDWDRLILADLLPAAHHGAGALSVSALHLPGV